MVVIKVIEIKTNNTKIIWKQGVFLQHTFLKSFFPVFGKLVPTS